MLEWDQKLDIRASGFLINCIIILIVYTWKGGTKTAQLILGLCIYMLLEKKIYNP
ncbi:hypothetical protein BGX38DRAFT_1161685 [Terfezia claveryi]|nr:hypothetical protein BGX38DRAFT_1161685 [Terfezia claveryi]